MLIKTLKIVSLNIAIASIQLFLVADMFDMGWNVWQCLALSALIIPNFGGGVGSSHGYYELAVRRSVFNVVGCLFVVIAYILSM